MALDVVENKVLNVMDNPTLKMPTPPSSTLTLTITFDQLTGATQVNGPINNAMVAYGMLEAAKDAIRSHIAKLAENPSGIVGASAMPLAFRQ